MAELTDAEKQEIVESMFGTIKPIQSISLKMELPKAVEIFQSLVILRSDKHIRFFDNVYPNFEKFQDKPNEPLETTNLGVFDGDEFDMAYHFKGDVFLTVFEAMREMRGWNKDEKMLQYYQETGQTEKFEALKKKIEGENE